MIPKSLNFIWVGDPTRQPNELIQSWASRHPGWGLRVWCNDDLTGRRWINARHMRTMARERQWNGVADLMRWELLLEFGGVFLDADSCCLRPLLDSFLECEAFACWENEIDRPGLIAAGYLGAGPGNSLITRIVSDISHIPSVSGQEAWACVGPQRLTDSWRAMGYDDLTILPSHYFIPRHYAGRVYHGGGPVFADQAWGSTYDNYSLADFTHAWTPGEGSSHLPKVTIGISARNQCRWLMDALDSALAQDYPDFEVLVIDDESEDATSGLLASIKDPRLRVIRKQHTNFPDARNLILREAAGEYICWLDSDDILLPGTLRTYGERAHDWPSVSVFYGNLLQIDEAGRPKGRLSFDNHAGNRHLLARLLQKNHMPDPGTFVRTSAMRDAGGFDGKTAGSCAYDLWLRMAARREGFQHVGHDVVKHRWHEDHMSSRPEVVQQTDLYMLKKMLIEAPLDQLCSDLRWEDPPSACAAALLRMGGLLKERGDPELANSWLQKATLIKEFLPIFANRKCSATKNKLLEILSNNDQPLCLLSDVLFKDTIIDIDHVISQEALEDHGPKPSTENPEGLQNPEPAPACPPEHREAFLYEPDWNRTEWVRVVLSYVSAFKPDDPVGLMILLESGGKPDLMTAQDMILQVISMTEPTAVPEIILLDQAAEMLEAMKKYEYMQWIQPHCGEAFRLMGENGLRFSVLYDMLK